MSYVSSIYVLCLRRYRDYEKFDEGVFLQKVESTNFSLFSDDPTQYYTNIISFLLVLSMK